MQEGNKFDNDKLRYDLLSPTALEGLVRVLTYGARKYAARNWEQGIAYGRVFGACMRHLWTWWRGEDIDPESGLPHLDHAQCCLHFLSHYRIHKKQFDDRPQKNKSH